MTDFEQQMTPEEASAKGLLSQDVAAEKREQLKQLFPEVFSEDKIDFAQLQRVLGDWVEPEKERFGLNWPGKAECMKVIQQPSIATLKPIREESVCFDDTENVFIEGDNLEVLKLLQKSYFGKVKMIYIDPPYNTGKEFIYPDRYAESLETYLAYTGQIDAQGNRFSTNTDSGGRYHSNWLNMMYPRLYLARSLLRDDGVIFISIDDNEQSHLRELCDFVFGEENFVTEFVWKRRASSAMADNNVSADHEYVITYQRGRLEGFLGVEKDFKNYKNPDNDPRGSWVLGDLTVGMTASMRPNQAYDLVDPKTGNTFPYNPNRVWAYIPSSMKKMLDEGRIFFPDDSSKRPMQKRFKNELKGTHNPLSSLIIDKVGLNTEGTRQIQQIMGGNIFDYPKPLSLLTTLIPQVCNDDDIILDFFAGSCATAHAVMELNRQDGGNRKFICVQLPEPVDEKSEARKHGYATIADIGKERIRRAAKKIVEQDAAQLNLQGGTPDLGFKVFRLARSNFKIWQGEVEKNDDLTQSLIEHIEHIRQASTAEDLLYELLLKAGFALTTSIERRQMPGGQVYRISEGALIICLEKEITSELIDAIAADHPFRVICLDEGFQNNDQLKANAVHTFKSRARLEESEIVFTTV